MSMGLLMERTYLVRLSDANHTRGTQHRKIIYAGQHTDISQKVRRARVRGAWAQVLLGTSPLSKNTEIRT